MVEVNTWVFALLWIVVTIGTLIVVGLFAAIAIALRKVEQQVEKVTRMAEPLVAKVSNTLDTVQRITENVGEKADTILTKGEALTDDLAVKVEKTSTVVQKSVASPLINLSSLITGLSAGLSVWGRSATENAREATHTHSRNGTTQTTEERHTVSTDGR